MIVTRLQKKLIFIILSVVISVLAFIYELIFFARYANLLMYEIVTYDYNALLPVQYALNGYAPSTFIYTAFYGEFIFYYNAFIAWILGGASIYHLKVANALLNIPYIWGIILILKLFVREKERWIVLPFSVLFFGVSMHVGQMSRGYGINMAFVTVIWAYFFLYNAFIQRSKLTKNIYSALCGMLIGLGYCTKYEYIAPVFLVTIFIMVLFSKRIPKLFKILCYAVIVLCYMFFASFPLTKLSYFPAFLYFIILILLDLKRNTGDKFKKLFYPSQLIVFVSVFCCTVAFFFILLAYKTDISQAIHIYFPLFETSQRLTIMRDFTPQNYKHCFLPAMFSQIVPDRIYLTIVAIIFYSILRLDKKILLYFMYVVIAITSAIFNYDNPYSVYFVFYLTFFITLLKILFDCTNYKFTGNNVRRLLSALLFTSILFFFIYKEGNLDTPLLMIIPVLLFIFMFLLKMFFELSLKPFRIYKLVFLLSIYAGSVTFYARGWGMNNIHVPVWPLCFAILFSIIVYGGNNIYARYFRRISVCLGLMLLSFNISYFAQDVNTISNYKNLSYYGGVFDLYIDYENAKEYHRLNRLIDRFIDRNDDIFVLSNNVFPYIIFNRIPNSGLFSPNYNFPNKELEKRAIDYITNKNIKLIIWGTYSTDKKDMTKKNYPDLYTFIETKFTRVAKLPKFKIYYRRDCLN